MTNMHLETDEWQRGLMDALFGVRKLAKDVRRIAIAVPRKMPKSAPISTAWLKVYAPERNHR